MEKHKERRNSIKNGKKQRVMEQHNKTWNNMKNGGKHKNGVI